MVTPTVTPIHHNGCSPHAPTPVRPAVKRRWSVRVVGGVAVVVARPTALKPETFVRV